MSTVTGKRPAAPYQEQQPRDKRSRVGETTTAPLYWKGANGMRGGDAVIAKFPAKFTRVHLQLLKVLYPQSNANQDDDGSVKNRQWDCMEQFLQNRENIKCMAAKVKVTEAIQNETSAFEELVKKSFLLTKSSSTSFTVTTETVSRLSSRRNSRSKTEPSSSSSKSRSTVSTIHPRSARFFSGAAKFGSSSSPGSGRKGRYSAMKQQQPQPVVELDGNPFGIFSTLLKHKHQMTAQEFQGTSAPLRSLVQDTEARVKFLTTKLEEIAEQRKQTGFGSLFLVQAFLNDSNTNSNFLDIQKLEEARVRMETKLELWNILLQDLGSNMK